MRASPILSSFATALPFLLLGGCGGGRGDSGGGIHAAAHGLACKELHDSIPGGQGSGVPGVAGAPRWGMPGGKVERARVRRSWSRLGATEKREVVDAFVKLKRTTVDSSGAGSARANYKGFCDNYSHDLYDYYVELHASAFTSMKTNDMSHTQMAHMGPQFLPWHRYVLLRLEADLREVSGDPDFMLPYFDWEDCQTVARPGESACPKIFETQYLGSPGACDQHNQVTGYLVDQGFTTHVWTHANAQDVFSTSSINCSEKALQRAAGCNLIGERKPATAQEVVAIYARKVYDAAPYDSCGTDESVSFRQYLEGYTKSDVNPSASSPAARCTASGTSSSAATWAAAPGRSTTRSSSSTTPTSIGCGPSGRTATGRPRRPPATTATRASRATGAGRSSTSPRCGRTSCSTSAPSATATTPARRSEPSPRTAPDQSSFSAATKSMGPTKNALPTK
jgi:hypothetical protein